MMSTVSLSEYERVREENIRRNETFLDEIGIKPSNTSSHKGTSRKRPRPEKVEKPIDITQLRRSSRVASLPIDHVQLSYTENSDYEDDDVKKGIRYGRRATVRNKDHMDSPDKEKVKYETKVHNLDNAPSRELVSEFEIFIGVGASTGAGGGSEADMDTASNNNLGNILENVGFGKAAIMTASRAVQKCPKFSKYSGVVEWRNCVYLWVNIGSSKPGEYINEFKDGGKYMTWYGGSRMHMDSPVTKRLISPTVKNNTVLLFVRLEGEPYACLGPVKAVEYDIETHPIAFTWELTMFSHLKDRDNFKRILKAAR